MRITLTNMYCIESLIDHNVCLPGNFSRAVGAVVCHNENGHKLERIFLPADTPQQMTNDGFLVLAEIKTHNYGI